MDGYRIIEELEKDASFTIANNKAGVLAVLVDELNDQMSSAKDANQNLEHAQERLSDAHHNVNLAIEKLLQARVDVAEAEVDFVSACNHVRRAISKIIEREVA